MTGDPIIPPQAGDNSCMALQLSLAQGTADVLLPQIEHGYAKITPISGTCDPECMKRYIAEYETLGYRHGGMALTTDNADTTTVTLSSWADYYERIKPEVLTQARPTNQGLKNVSPFRVARRRKKNKQARKARRK